MAEIAIRFATTEFRKALMKGLIQYRAQLREIGIIYGFQWLDGSFVEDIERISGRSPRDIDVVTFGVRPSNIPDMKLITAAHPELFNPALAKQKFLCDGYFVDLGLSQVAVHDYTTYWLNLFSHQRATGLWKGMVKVPLQSDDTAALSIIQA